MQRSEASASSISKLGPWFTTRGKPKGMGEQASQCARLPASETRLLHLSRPQVWNHSSHTGRRSLFTRVLYRITDGGSFQTLARQQGVLTLGDLRNGGGGGGVWARKSAMHCRSRWKIPHSSPFPGEKDQSVGIMGREFGKIVTSLSLLTPKKENCQTAPQTASCLNTLVARLPTRGCATRDASSLRVETAWT